jgi:uncharacterized protein (UPF0333 family)
MKSYRMGEKKRCQVSMEYMLMVGFSLLLITPVIVIYGTERQSISDQVSYSQAKQIATKIADSAETVYYLGKPSRTTIRVYMPYNIQDISFNNYEVVVTLKMATHISEAIAVSSVNMVGNLTARPGIHEILFIADENQVNVTNA